MKDLELWRLLRAGLEGGTAAALVPLLRQLATRPIAERWPFYAAIGPALRSGDGAVRAAAVATLADAKGPLALPAIAGALDDPDPEVRLAAVEALRITAVSDPDRWAHALFHPRDDVRRAAVAADAPMGARGLEAWLLADPICAGVVRDRVQADLALPALLDFAARGVIPAEDARRWISAAAPATVIAVLDRGRRRNHDEVWRVLLHDAAEPAPADAIDDECDALIALFSDPGAAADPVRRFFLGLRAPLLSRADLRSRIAASIVSAARRTRGAIPSEALGLAVLHHPLLLAQTWLPRELRHASIATLHQLGAAMPKLAAPSLHPLLECDVVRTRTGKLDPWAIGGLLWMAAANPYQTLFEKHEPDDVARAMLRDLTYAAPLLALPDDGKLGRGRLIDALVAEGADRRGEIFAHVAWASGGDDVLHLGVPADQLIPAVRGLLGLEARPGGPSISPTRLDRVTTLLAGEIVRLEREHEFFGEWLSWPEPEKTPIGLAIFGRIARELAAERFVELALKLRTPLLRRLLDAIPSATALPFGKEMALATALLGHSSPAIHAWATERSPGTGRPVPPKVAPDRAIAPLPPAITRRISTCPETDLDDAVLPCLTQPCLGLSAALGARPAPTAANVAVCAALLACHDPIADVAREFERWVAYDPGFLGELEQLAVSTWRGNRDLPLLGHAWLWRFELHCFRAADALASHAGGLAAALDGALTIPSELLRTHVWRAASHACAMWRWRDPDRLAAVTTETLIDLCVTELDGDVGFAAAELLVAIWDSARAGAVFLEARRPAIVAVLPEIADSVRELLRSIVDARGLPTRAVGARAHRPATPEDLLAAIRTSEDLELLARACRSDEERAVHEAALRLIMLGDRGLAVLVDLLAAEPPPLRAGVLALSIALWPDGRAVEAIRARVIAEQGTPDLRFRLALGLIERGDPAMIPFACRAACEGGDGDWLRPRDYERLRAHAPDPLALAIALATSPHPNAYTPSVTFLIAQPISHPEGGAPVDGALAAFLECGTERLRSLRQDAALRLHERGDGRAFPILLGAALSTESGWFSFFVGLDPQLIAASVEAVLYAGPGIASESMLLKVLDQAHVDPDARSEALARLLADLHDDSLRMQVVRRIARSRHRESKLMRIAEIFAWGVRMARELTGRVMRVHMTSGGQLGWTRLGESSVWVTPLPVLQGERHATDLVEALVLHEIGHHVHHRGAEADEVWRRADQEGIGGLLNLVADEHLERNLRAYDASFGDRLKRLAAWAFQHSRRELPLRAVLQVLSGRAFEVLSRSPLEVARTPGSIAVDNGALLAEMERAGLSFARFVRALRMGLGDRWGDEKVARGLALFKSEFRKREMGGLLEIAHQLRDIFGWEVCLVEHLGTHETLRGEVRDGIIHGEGIDDAEVQEEVERILDPRQLGDPNAPRGEGRRKLAINVAPDEHFEPITRVEKVPFEADKHREHAARVKRHAAAMRRVLEELGLAYDPRRLRLRGRRYDPTRTRAVVTRGDPRMLIARERVVKTDLFLGVIVDCSGSMEGQSIERARLFGTLLAEASRGLAGVDVRVFGFTHDVIWDAGDARRCAAASLEADGGNNDAGALHYVAQVAKASARRAKLLVMISDGLPTECSVEALRALVRNLTRREQMCCAQVAVRPLEEVCFPHYVVLEEDEIDPAVKRFGIIVTGLVRRAISA